MANLDNLKNIPSFTLDKERIGNGTSVSENIIQYTKDNLGGLWFDGVTLILFICLLWFFSRKEDPNAYGISKAVTISSILCFVISVGFLLSGWSRNITPLLLYGSLMVIGFIFVWIGNKRRFG